MKIAYVITRGDAVGGASIHVRDLSRAMQDRGHEVRVFVGGTGHVTEQLQVPWESLEHLGRSVHPARDWQAYQELRSAFSKYAPDLVSVHTAKAGWLGRAAASRLNIPTIYTPHGWAITDRISRTQGAIFTVAERIASAWCSAIVCVSHSERRLALQKRVARPDQLHVIHNGVRPVSDRFLASPEAEPVRIISVARFEPPKDHSTLLRALAELRSLSWELELLGDGPNESQVRLLASTLGLESRVRFAGYQRDPAAALARAQLFVLSSRSEGFPRSTLEAMRAGLPVVASDVGGVSEAVQDGVTGLLVPSGDSSALAAALRRLIKSGSERQLMGGSGHLFYKERFTLDCMLDNTFRLYATIVGVPVSTI